MNERCPAELVGVRRRGGLDVLPRDGGMVVRLKGPYNTPDVDYWPTTGTCAQIIVGGTPIVYRRVSPEFAEALALHGSVGDAARALEESRKRRVFG